MKILIHSPYWNARGGGERYMLTVASSLQDNHRVFVTIQTAAQLKDLSSRLEINVEKVSTFPAPLTKWALTAFGGIFWLSDGSIPFLPTSRRVIHFQAPFQHVGGRSLKNRLKLVGTTIVCNSRYTKQFIDRELNISSRVIFPPVEISHIAPGRKEKMILTVGRFSTSSQHKRQDVLIDSFQSFWKAGMKGWRMVVVGTVEDANSRLMVTELRRKSRGYPIAIRTDLSRPALIQLYKRAFLYWHAAGYDTNLSLHPERAEHFGISTVEAMAAGAIPCSFAAGGQAEIITDGINGVLWRNPADLIRESILLTTKKDRSKRMMSAAVTRSHDFSRERFSKKIQELFE